MSHWQEVRLSTGHQPDPPTQETWAEVTKRALEICAETGHDFWIADDRAEDVQSVAAENGLVIERLYASMFRVSKAA